MCINQRLFGETDGDVLYFFKKLLHVNFCYSKNKNSWRVSRASRVIDQDNLDTRKAVDTAWNPGIWMISAISYTPIWYHIIYLVEMGSCYFLNISFSVS